MITNYLIGKFVLFVGESNHNLLFLFHRCQFTIILNRSHKSRTNIAKTRTILVNINATSGHCFDSTIGVTTITSH